MENKKTVNLSTVLLIVAIIIIVMMGYFIYNFSNQKNLEIADLNSQIMSFQSEISNVQGKIDNISNTIDSTEDEKSNLEYLENFSKSVSKELGDDNVLFAESSYGQYTGVFGVSVNSKSEAYVELLHSPDSEFYKEHGAHYKIDDDVVNAYIFSEQDGLNENLFLLKKDGTVEVLYLESEQYYNGLKPQKMDNVKDIVDIVPISGGEENGIGGLGVLFITSDGNCVPYFPVHE